MTRRESRESAFRIVFGMSVNKMDIDEALFLAEEAGEPQMDEFAKRLVKAVYNHTDEINGAIAPFLKEWSIDRLARTSLAILQISYAQLFYWDDISETGSGITDERSDSVIINEAVELSKQYGAADDYSFVNGVLGSIVRDGAFMENEKTDGEHDGSVDSFNAQPVC